MFDEFLKPYWNLDQVRAWAETRDRELVRIAAVKSSFEIVTRTIHKATEICRKGRDVDAELWAASGWIAPLRKFEPPLMVQSLLIRLLDKGAAIC